MFKATLIQCIARNESLPPLTTNLPTLTASTYRGLNTREEGNSCENKQIRCTSVEPAEVNAEATRRPNVHGHVVGQCCQRSAAVSWRVTHSHCAESPHPCPARFVLRQDRRPAEQWGCFDCNPQTRAPRGSLVLQDATKFCSCGRSNGRLVRRETLTLKDEIEITLFGARMRESWFLASFFIPGGDSICGCSVLVTFTACPHVRMGCQWSGVIVTDEKRMSVWMMMIWLWNCWHRFDFWSWIKWRCWRIVYGACCVAKWLFWRRESWVV